MQQSVCVRIHFVFLGFIIFLIPPLEIREGGGDTSGCIKHAVNPVVCTYTILCVPGH